MDIELVIGAYNAKVELLCLDVDFMRKDKYCAKPKGGDGEKEERKKYKLNRNENIGLKILGIDEGVKYITIITDQRFIVRKVLQEEDKKKNIKEITTKYRTIKWESTKSLSYSDGNLVFKSTGRSHERTVPVKLLDDTPSVKKDAKLLDEIGQFIVSLIEIRFHLQELLKERL